MSLRHATNFLKYVDYDRFNEFRDPSQVFTTMSFYELDGRVTLSGRRDNWTTKCIMAYGCEDYPIGSLDDGVVRLRLRLRLTEDNRMCRLYCYDDSEDAVQVRIYTDSANGSKWTVWWLVNSAGGTLRQETMVFSATQDDLFHTVEIRYQAGKLYAKVDDEAAQEIVLDAGDYPGDVTWYRTELTGYGYYAYYELMVTDLDIYEEADLNTLRADGVADPETTFYLFDTTSAAPTYTKESDTEGVIDLSDVTDGYYWLLGTNASGYSYFSQVRIISGEIQ